LAKAASGEPLRANIAHQHYVKAIENILQFALIRIGQEVAEKGDPS